MRKIRGSGMNKFSIAVLAGLTACQMATQALAIAPPEIVRIEEDWQLEIRLVDAEQGIPAVVTSMHPGGKNGAIQFEFAINHAKHPTFSPGGYQLRVLAGDKTIAHRRKQKGRRLTEGEKISWTQVIQKTEEGTYFGVTSGESQTWGQFGGVPSFLFLKDSETDFKDLAGYNVKQSLKTAELAEYRKPYASLKLVEVRIHRDGVPVESIRIESEVQ